MTVVLNACLQLALDLLVAFSIDWCLFNGSTGTSSIILHVTTGISVSWQHQHQFKGSITILLAVDSFCPQLAYLWYSFLHLFLHYRLLLF